MPEPIRVLHVLPDLATGGGQRLVLNLAQALRPRVEVEIAFLSGSDELRTEFHEAGVRVHELPRGEGAWSQLRTAASLARLVRRRGIDLLHAHSSPDKRVTQLAGLFARRPVVAHLHVLRNHSEHDRGAAGWFRSNARRLAGLLTVRCYIAISQSVFDANTRAVPFARRRLVLVRNGVPLDHADMAADGVRDDIGLRGDDQVLLWVGRLSTEKDVPSLVRMMSIARETNERAHLVLVGEGRRRQDIEDLVAQLDLGDRVHLVGRRTDVSSIMSVADLFAFASFHEGFGLAVAEAQVAGLPVVAFRIPALEEIVEDRVTGLLVPGRRPEDLAASVTRLLDDAALRQAMGAAARTRGRQLFDISSTAAELAGVYERVLGRPRV
jgi:glycosyltransferase involved in cell wall biosynthesis